LFSSFNNPLSNKYCAIKNADCSQLPWLTPVILGMQEDSDSKPAQANNSQNATLKNPSQQRAWSGSSCRPGVQASVLQNNNCKIGTVRVRALVGGGK
jgi:hypothetical protein